MADSIGFQRFISSAEMFSLTNPYYIYVPQHLQVSVSRCIPCTVTTPPSKRAHSFYLILRRQPPIILLCKVFKGEV